MFTKTLLRKKELTWFHFFCLQKKTENKPAAKATDTKGDTVVIGGDVPKQEVETFNAAAEYKRFLSKSPVVIFSKSGCPYSKAAKELLLKKYTITPEPFVVELDLHPHGADLQNILAAWLADELFQISISKASHVVDVTISVLLKSKESWLPMLMLGSQRRRKRLALNHPLSKGWITEMSKAFVGEEIHPVWRYLKWVLYIYIYKFEDFGYNCVFIQIICQTTSMRLCKIRKWRHYMDLIES